MQNLQTPDYERRFETRKKTSLTKILTWAFLTIGAIILLASYVVVSSILAFIGLGLLFWGVIFIYIQPEQYTKKAVVEATVTPPIGSLNQIIHELNYKGIPIYLPPKNFKDPEANKIYICKQKNLEIPEPEKILKYENHLFLDDPPGILLTPPGAQLSNLFEKQLDVSFAKTDLNYVTQNLPKLLTDDLEIADKVKIETEENQIKIGITNSIFQEANKGNNKSSDLYPYFSHPVLSAIACALTKATGKPVIIENTQSSDDGKTVEATYQVLEEVEAEEIETETYLPETKTEEPLVERLQQIGNRFLPDLASLLLTAIGSIILAQVAWITFYDMTVWGKDIALIFFGSRTGQAISFGIGLTLIHYFILGMASFFSGMILYLLRRRKE
jgi:hypothetical protein